MLEDKGNKLLFFVRQPLSFCFIDQSVNGVALIIRLTYGRHGPGSNGN